MTQDGKRSLEELVREAWATALGGGPGLGAIKQRVQHLLDLTQEESTHLWTGFFERVKKNSEELERRLEERFRAAVTLLGSPLQAEVRALRGRAEELGQRLEHFTRRRQGSPGAPHGSEPGPGNAAPPSES
jgi:polyhydroxyalkanoate synthesis regulator phasin